MNGTIDSAYEPGLTQEERALCLIGGGLLTLVGLSRRSTFGLLVAAAGGSLIYRGIMGHSLRTQILGTTARQRNAPPWRRPIRVERTITVDRPREEVYRFWRDLENLPRFMTHLVSVVDKQDGRSHWVAKGPAGHSVEWEASMTHDEPNEQISWESLPGSEIANKGTVRFMESPSGGTELRVIMEYLPPAGRLGDVIAKILGDDPHQQVDEDLRHFKELVEDNGKATKRRAKKAYMA